MVGAARAVVAILHVARYVVSARADAWLGVAAVLLGMCASAGMARSLNKQPVAVVVAAVVVAAVVVGLPACWITRRKSSR